MASLILGPIVRYVGTTEATVWVETDSRCEVEVLGHRAATFSRRRKTLCAGADNRAESGPAAARRMTFESNGVARRPPPESGFPAEPDSDASGRGSGHDRVRVLPRRGAQEPHTPSSPRSTSSASARCAPRAGPALARSGPGSLAAAAADDRRPGLCRRAPPETRSRSARVGTSASWAGRGGSRLREYSWLYREAWSPPASAVAAVDVADPR